MRRLIAPWTGPAGLAAAAVLLVQLVWRAWYLAHGYFTQDDFLVLHLGGTSGFGPHYFFQNYSGHLFPGGFAFAYLEAHLAPLSWPAAYLPALVMQFGAGALMWLLLGRLLGDRWERVPLLVVFCVCPMTLWSTQWWIVSVHFLPTELLTLAAALTYLRWKQDGSVWGRRLTVVFAAAGLLFQERSILIPLVVLVVAVVVEPTPGILARLGVILRTDRRVWLTLSMVVAAYLALHAWLAPLGSTGSRVNPWSLSLVSNFFLRNLVPGIVGGPWSGDLLGGAAIIPPTWVVVVTCVLVAALVGSTAWFGGTTARLAWLVLLGYGLLDVALLFGGRAQFGGILGLTPRYTADVVLILVVVLAGAVRELEPPMLRGHRRTLACVVVVIGYVTSAAITSHHTAPALYNTAGREYVDTLRQDLADRPGVVLFDSQVPPDLMISWFGADARVSTVYGVADDAPPFDVPSEEMRIVDRSGHVRQFTLERKVTAPSGPNPQCGYNITLNPTVVPLSGPVGNSKSVIQLAYFTNVDDVGELRAGGQTVSFPVAPGLHSVSIVVGAAFDSISVRLTRTAGTLCLGSVRAGRPRPAVS